MHAKLYLKNLLFIAEDNYYGSGSGGGSGFDEEDDTGSGLGPWEVTDDPILKGDISRSGSNSGGAGNNEIIDSTTSHKNVPPSVDGGSGGSSGGSGGTSSTAGSGSSSRAPEMSITRALLQFFLPLVIAWFGGIFADLL